MTRTSQKDRFLKTMLGGQADRFPYYDLEPAEETIQRWRQEGLPPGETITEYFHLERHYSVGLTIRSYPYYKKPSDLLNDPRAFARHYDPDEPTRYAKNWVERGKYLNENGRVLYVDASGGGLLQMLGVGDWESLKSACSALIERPAMVEELLDRTTDFYCVCLKRVLSEVTVDYASFYEPIASNVGPVISPAMFERFAMPGYRKVLSLMEEYQVPLRFLCTTGGSLTSLLPPLVEAGINGLWISNIQIADMQYASLRRRFGSDLALIGGIDAGVLTRDDATIRQVLEETVLPLLERAQYLPCLDDRPRINVPFAQYRLYREILEEIASKA